MLNNQGVSVYCVAIAWYTSRCLRAVKARIITPIIIYGI